MALSTLTTTYPNHLIILGGDFQGDWTSPSDKSCHLRTLPFTRFEGPQLPTFTPAHLPSQGTCIDHFLIFDPHNIAPQSKDTHIIPHAFLDHNGVKTTLQLPLLLSHPHSTTNPTCETDQPRPIRFQFPIPQPLLAQWSDEMREATQQPTAQLQLELGRLLSEIQNTPPTNTTSTRKERINKRNRIIEHADTIQDLLAEGLRIASTLFPTKTTSPRTANMIKRRY